MARRGVASKGDEGASANARVKGERRGNPLYVAHRRCLALVRCRSARRVTLKLPPSSLVRLSLPFPPRVGSSRPFPPSPPRTAPRAIVAHWRWFTLLFSPASALLRRTRARFSLATRCSPGSSAATIRVDVPSARPCAALYTLSGHRSGCAARGDRARRFSATPSTQHTDRRTHIHTHTYYTWYTRIVTQEER